LSIYAWKITTPDKAVIEGITTLEGLEKALTALDLPRTGSPNEIVSQTRLMEHEGQGVYKHNVDGEQWTLLWVALR
jgi:hypothetical protein